MAGDLNHRVTKENHPLSPPRGEWFASTHWSVVLAAKEGDSITASEALEKTS